MSAARGWVSNRGGGIGFFVFGGCGVPLFLWVWGLWWGVSGPSGWWGGLVCAGGGIIRVFCLGGGGANMGAFFVVCDLLLLVVVLFVFWDFALVLVWLGHGTAGVVFSGLFGGGPWFGGLCGLVGGIVWANGIL